MANEEEGAEPKTESPEAAQVNAEVEVIMGVLAQKGDTTELLRATLCDKDKIKSEGLKLKQIFLEVLFIKYGVHSLEHVTRGVEKVRAAVDGFFKDDVEAQRMALETIFKAFGMDQINKQDYSKDNLFQIQFKLCNLILRLEQLDVINTTVALDWCFDKLQEVEGEVQHELA